jgi:hypothetical protein
LFLDRRFLDCWQYTNAEWWKVWSYLMGNVSDVDRPELGIRKGQLLTTLTEINRVTKISRETIRRFLHLCIEKNDIIWEKNPGGRVAVSSNAVSDLVSDPVSVSSRITLLNYSKYNSVKASRKSVPKSVPKSVLTDEQKVYHKKIFDKYVQMKREFHERPKLKLGYEKEKQLAGNISTLLQDYSGEEILAGLSNFSKDAWAIEKGLPWNFFMNDPASWIDREKLKKKTTLVKDEQNDDWKKSDPAYQTARRMQEEQNGKHDT